MNMGALLKAVVGPLEYRLEPENWLPAAYDDAVDALLWVKHNAAGGSHGDPWIRKYADLSKCFLLGGNSGGNIAYNTGLLSLNLDLKPLKIVGLILSQTLFGGVERTESELRLKDDGCLPLVVADIIWDLALPICTDRDNIYSNPLLHRPHDHMKIESLPSCLVLGYEGDPLVDRHRPFLKMLKEHVVCVTSEFREGGVHAAEVSDPTKVQTFLDDVKAFICSLGTHKGPHNLDDGSCL